MFIYCNTCRRYHRDSQPRCVATAEKIVKRPTATWPPPWHAATAADARIARKFKTVKTVSMF